MPGDDIGRVLAAIDGIAVRLETLEQGQAKLEQGLARLEQGHARLEQSHSRLEQGYLKTRADIMERIDRVQQTLKSVQDDLTVNLGAVDSVRHVHDNTRSELRALNDVVAAMERQILGLKARVDHLEEKSGPS